MKAGVELSPFSGQNSWHYCSLFYTTAKPQSDDERPIEISGSLGGISFKQMISQEIKRYVCL